MSGWLDDLEERAGPLHAAALGFCSLAAIDPALRGAPAAQALGRALDAFCHQLEGDDPYEEDRFIEGAGAFLGLLLLDTHGGGGHQQLEGNHRVRLGPRGWFDPFAAIDTALDADEPLLALAESLALAEAEAEGAGPISAVLGALESALERDYPEQRVLRAFELDVELEDGTQIDLRRVASGLAWPHTDADRQRLGRDMTRLVAMLPRRAGSADALGAAPRDPRELAETLARLLPRPIPLTFAEGLPEGVRLASAPLAPDVLLAYVEQHAGRARFLREDELEALGGAALVHTAALTNLRRRSASMRFEPLHQGGLTFLAAKTGDGLDAARVILGEAHAQARTLLPGVAVAVIPHRDTILFARAADAPALQRYARDLLQRAPHAISASAIPLP